MPEEVKFTEKEINQIKDIQKTYANIQNAFGQVGLSKLRIEQDVQNMRKAEESLKNKFKENQDTEKKFIDEITKKYGDGNLNIDTGTFTPKATTKTSK
jgi:predicted nuclease with TOPRIM domain